MEEYLVMKTKKKNIVEIIREGYRWANLCGPPRECRQRGLVHNLMKGGANQINKIDNHIRKIDNRIRKIDNQIRKIDNQIRKIDSQIRKIE